MGAWSLSHWPAREVPSQSFYVAVEVSSEVLNEPSWPCLPLNTKVVRPSCNYPVSFRSAVILSPASTWALISVRSFQGPKLHHLHHHSNFLIFWVLLLPSRVSCIILKELVSVKFCENWNVSYKCQALFCGCYLLTGLSEVFLIFSGVTWLSRGFSEGNLSGNIYFKEHCLI